MDYLRYAQENITPSGYAPCEGASETMYQSSILALVVLAVIFR